MNFPQRVPIDRSISRNTDNAMSVKKVITTPPTS